MIQRTIPHLPRRFSRCKTCGTEPRHVESHGRKAGEPGLLFQRIVRHSLECAACGVSTALHATVADAEAEWGTDYAQLALPLRTRRPRRKAAA